MIATDYIFGKKHNNDPNPIEIKAWHSFHQLNAGYNRFGIVRRLSDNATQEIGFYNGFFDEADAVSFSGGAEMTITQWDNQFSNNHLLAKNSSREPILFDSNGLIKYDNTPAIRFNGHAMESAVKYDWGERFLVLGVVKSLVTGARGLINADYLTGTRVAQLLRGRYEFLNLYASAPGVSQTTITQDPTGMLLAQILRRTGTIPNQYLRINEFEDFENEVFNIRTGLEYLQLGAIGGGYFGNGYLSEVQLSFGGESEQLDVVDDIKQRHGIIF